MKESKARELLKKNGWSLKKINLPNGSYMIAERHGNPKVEGKNIVDLMDKIKPV